MVTPFSPEQLAWLEAKFSGPTPPHSSAGSGDPTGTSAEVAGSSEDALMQPPVSPNRGVDIAG